MSAPRVKLVADEDRRPFFTPKDLALYLRMSERTIRQMLADGAIPSHKMAGVRRIAADDVDAYVARTRNEAA